MEERTPPTSSGHGTSPLVWGRVPPPVVLKSPDQPPGLETRAPPVVPKSLNQPPGLETRTPPVVLKPLNQPPGLEKWYPPRGTESEVVPTPGTIPEN